MLDFTRTSVVEARELPTVNTTSITAEGQALVVDYTGGVCTLKASAGTGGEIYYGCSLAQQLTLLELPEIVVDVVATSYTLPHTPIGGSIYIYNVTAGSEITFNAGAGSGQYNIVGNVLTFNAAQVGNTFRAQYRYVPTTLEAQTIQGSIPPGGAASLLLNSMGAIIKGQIATSNYDTAVNWNVANPVLTLGAGGRYTLGGSGGAVPGAKIINIPSSEDSFLVFEI